jgi:Carbohydrate-selective porin, OprB family
MSNISWKLLFAVPAAYAISFFASANAFAASEVTPQAVAATSLDVVDEIVANTTPNAVIAKNAEASESGALIQPTDWQYASLKSLESKYNCSSSLTGAAVSRTDFATGLNACLLKAEPVLANNPSSASAQDLEVLQRLTQEFRAELTNLDIRIEKVQRTALAQSASQFSTTTKLKGEVVIGLNGVISGGAANSNATVSDRVRLLLETTFTGKDKLYTRLAAGNFGGYGELRNGATVEGAPTYAGYVGNSVIIDWLAYQFPLGRNSVYAAAVAGITSDYADTHSPYFQDFNGGNGALSFLAEENPIYKIGGGTGVGLTVPLNNGNNTFIDSLNLGYFVGTTANDPNAGLFGGKNALFAQVNFKPSDKFDFGLTYVNAYHAGGAIYDFGTGGPIVGSFLTGAGFSNSNSFGLSAAYKASDNLSLNGYVSKTSASLIGGGANADILTYGVGAAFPNVGQPGNLLGFFVGQAPTVTNAPGFASSAYQLEGFYKYKLNDGLSITPGLIYLTNPNQLNASNGGSLIGTIRTTLTF